MNKILIVDASDSDHNRQITLHCLVCLFFTSSFNFRIIVNYKAHAQSYKPFVSLNCFIILHYLLKNHIIKYKL